MTELLSVKQVAEQLKLSTQTVRELIKAGQLEAYKVGNKHQTTQEFIHEYLERQKVQVKQ